MLFCLKFSHLNISVVNFFGITGFGICISTGGVVLYLLKMLKKVLEKIKISMSHIKKHTYYFKLTGFIVLNRDTLQSMTQVRRVKGFNNMIII